MDSEIEALPQLRFPLREALLSLHDSVNEPPSVRTALTGSASLATLGPYKVSSTEKSRALKKIGRLKRRGEHIGRGYAEERPLHTPRPPPESERPKTVPKSVPSAVSRKKVAFVRSAQDAAEMECWPSLQKSQSAPEVSSMSCFSATPNDMSTDIRPTWTSTARAVLGHGRRQATRQHATSKGSKGSKGEAEQMDAPPAGLLQDTSWCSASLSSFPGLPKPLKDWAIMASSGLEFTDAGFGLGDRENPEVKNLIKRSPGFHYEVKCGNVGLWNSDASLPTKQPLSQHFSAASAPFGARRDPQKKYERQPGPGYYDVPGFTDELLRKVAKRPAVKPA